MGSTAWSVLMLLLVLALVPLVLWTVKRLQTIRPAGGGALPMQVAAQLALGPRERIVLLRVGERQLLLGVTPQQITLLTEAEAAPQPAPAKPAGTSTQAFASVLRANLRRQPGPPPAPPASPG